MNLSTKARYPVIEMTKEEALNMIVSLSKALQDSSSGVFTINCVENESKPSGITFFVDKQN